RPVVPPASRTSTSTVGLPRESRISRALTATIVDRSFMEATGYNTNVTDAGSRTPHQLRTRLAARHASRAGAGSSGGGDDARVARTRRLQSGLAGRVLGSRPHADAGRGGRGADRAARRDAAVGGERVRAARGADARRSRCARDLSRRASGA